MKSLHVPDTKIFSSVGIQPVIMKIGISMKGRSNLNKLRILEAILIQLQQDF